MFSGPGSSRLQVLPPSPEKRMPFPKTAAGDGPFLRRQVRHEEGTVLTLRLGHHGVVRGRPVDARIPEDCHVSAAGCGKKTPDPAAALHGLPGNSAVR